MDMSGHPALGPMTTASPIITLSLARGFRPRKSASSGHQVTGAGATAAFDSTKAIGERPSASTAASTMASAIGVGVTEADAGTTDTSSITPQSITLML